MAGLVTNDAKHTSDTHTNRNRGTHNPNFIKSPHSPQTHPISSKSSSPHHSSSSPRKSQPLLSRSDLQQSYYSTTKVEKYRNSLEGQSIKIYFVEGLIGKWEGWEGVQVRECTRDYRWKRRGGDGSWRGDTKTIVIDQNTYIVTEDQLIISKKVQKSSMISQEGKMKSSENQIKQQSQFNHQPIIPLLQLWTLNRTQISQQMSIHFQRDMLSQPLISKQQLLLKQQKPIHLCEKQQQQSLNTVIGLTLHKLIVNGTQETSKNGHYWPYLSIKLDQYDSKYSKNNQHSDKQQSYSKLLKQTNSQEKKDDSLQAQSHSPQFTYKITQNIINRLISSILTYHSKVKPTLSYNSHQLGYYQEQLSLLTLLQIERPIISHNHKYVGFMFVESSVFLRNKQIFLRHLLPKSVIDQSQLSSQDHDHPPPHLIIMHLQTKLSPQLIQFSSNHQIIILFDENRQLSTNKKVWRLMNRYEESLGGLRMKLEVMKRMLEGIQWWEVGGISGVSQGNQGNQGNQLNQGSKQGDPNQTNIHQNPKTHKLLKQFGQHCIYIQCNDNAKRIRIQRDIQRLISNGSSGADYIILAKDTIVSNGEEQIMKQSKTQHSPITIKITLQHISRILRAICRIRYFQYGLLDGFRFIYDSQNILTAPIMYELEQQIRLIIQLRGEFFKEGFSTLVEAYSVGERGRSVNRLR